MTNIKLLKLNDKYYNKYKFLFNYKYIKYNYINQNLLYNYIFIGNYKICNHLFKPYNNIYNDILFTKKDREIKLNIKFYKINDNYNNYIINKLQIYKKKSLIILNSHHILRRFQIQNKHSNSDILYFYNGDFTTDDIIKKSKSTKYDNLYNKVYSSFDPDTFKQFLINLKNNKENNNIHIPEFKYDLISCHIGYILGLGVTASYNMILQIPHFISTIVMSLKLIEKHGTLLLFWSIVNVNIPVIKKLLAILAYGFNSVSIIDNDINQNLFIGVPEYYIKCEGYKDNITNELLNQMIDIAIETFNKTYLVCDILDYYEDYTEKNPNHSLFYNKIDEAESDDEDSNDDNNEENEGESKNTSNKKLKTKTKKASKPITPIYYIEDINIPELDEIMKDSRLQFEVSLLMNKLEGIFVGYFKMVNNLIVNAITYDDDGVMIVKEEAIIQKDITNLTKIITMFEYNNLPYNKHALKVLLNKQDEILDKFYSLDIPVNVKLIQYGDNLSKHLNKTIFSNYSQSSISSDSYSSSRPSNDTENVNEFDVLYILYIYYNKIKLALQVKNKLLEDIDFNNYVASIPKIVEYAAYDFSIGLCEYLNIKYKDLPINIDNSFAKLWEILYTFNLIPHNVTTYKVLHLCETTGQQITCSKYWAKKYCPRLKMENYEWMANSLNPYNTVNKPSLGMFLGNGIGNGISNGNNFNLSNLINNPKNPIQEIDKFGLIKNNYDKWLWGDDSTGNITNTNNIKKIMKDLKTKWLNKSNINDKTDKTDINNKTDIIIKINRIDKSDKIVKNDRLHLIICDDSTTINNSRTDTFNMQKMELSHVINIIAYSSIGGNCCVKHFIPYKNIDAYTNSGNSNSNSNNSNNSNDTLESSIFFIGYLYMYFVAFDSMSLFKPNSSNPDNGEFYVICKGFNGINDKQMNNLFDILDNFKLNNTIIEKEHIPESFLKQVNNFLEAMSNLNIISIEKQNLLLTCYKNIAETDVKKYQQTNKILKCDNFFDKGKIDDMLMPKYREWIKIFNFK